MSGDAETLKRRKRFTAKARRKRIRRFRRLTQIGEVEDPQMTQRGTEMKERVEELNRMRSFVCGYL